MQFQSPFIWHFAKLDPVVVHALLLVLFSHRKIVIPVVLKFETFNNALKLEGIIYIVSIWKLECLLIWEIIAIQIILHRRVCGSIWGPGQEL